MRYNHLESVKDELVAPRLVERYAGLLEEGLDLCTNVACTCTSSATTWRSKGIAAAAAAACPGTSSHTLDRSLGNLVKFGFQSYWPAPSKPSLGNDHRIIANIETPSDHLGNEADHLIQGHPVKSNCYIRGRLARRIHN